jgi:SAM-dependent methyltransferase
LIAGRRSLFIDTFEEEKSNDARIPWVIYTYQYERKRPEYYDADQQEYLRDDIEFYLRFIRNIQGKTLELGYGTGRVLFQVAEAGYTIHGIDNSESMVRQYLKNRQNHGPETNARITTFQADMTRFKLNHTYDLVIVPFRGFACLLTDRDRFNCLLSIKKHLTGNGICIIPLPYVINELTEKALDRERVFLREDKFNGNSLRRYKQITAVHREEKILELNLTYELYSQGNMIETVTENLMIAYIRKSDFEALADRAGFLIEDIFGYYDFSPVGAGGKKEMIFILKHKPLT